MIHAATSVLSNAYQQAINLNTSIVLTEEQVAWIVTITKSAETQKAVLAALLTSLVKKAEAPAQDVRLHKVEMLNGYSGRSYDTNYVTPFLRQHFPRLAMKSGSGWLTRSIEQNHPFDQSFPGKIQNVAAKVAFLNILNDIEVNNADPLPYLIGILRGLSLNAPKAQNTPFLTQDAGNIDIETILDLVKRHLFAKYTGAGASRLPVLALYAVYELLMGYERFAGKSLLPLKSHTTSDLRAQSLGDIEVIDENNAFFEAVEVKHGIAITPALVQDAYEKFQTYPVRRYYLLTTSEPNAAQIDTIRDLVRVIRREHGCEVIINGVLPTLKYYLRLTQNPALFLERYSAALEADYAASTDLKTVHIEIWRTLLLEIALIKG